MFDFQSDAVRRGLRTLIDVLLAGGSSGLILAILKVFGVDMTPEQFAALSAALTPVLSVIKNALEDSSGKSFLIDKTRPDPDPVTETVAPIVEGDGTTADDLSESEPVRLIPVPEGSVLVAVDPEDVQEDDLVVGYTR